MIWAAVTGRRPLHRLFTKEQRAFFDAHAGEVEWDELTVLGPVSVQRAARPRWCGRRTVLLLAVVGVLLLVVDQAAGRLPRLLVSALVEMVYALLWFVLPAWSRGSPRRLTSAGRGSHGAPSVTTHPSREPQV